MNVLSHKCSYPRWPAYSRAARAPASWHAAQMVAQPPSRSLGSLAERPATACQARIQSWDPKPNYQS